jgi:hypothetical protein
VLSVIKELLMTKLQPGKVMKLFSLKFKIKAGLLLFVSIIPCLVSGQDQKGRVLSGETGLGIGFVNIGIIGKNVGTVTDADGNFSLAIEDIYNNDSLRFFMIGYESRSLLVSRFKEDSIKNIYLKPKIYNLHEVTVTYHKPREIKLGTEVVPNDLRSGFGYNNLGSEMGIKIHTRGPVKLEDINLNVGICTYDSVTYRLNIYQADNQGDYINILTVPIYISFSKDKINDAITYDLRKYSIVVEGNIMVALELYKDLGEGKLFYRTESYSGYTYHRKASEGKWTEAAGVIGMYLHGQVLK